MTTRRDFLKGAGALAVTASLPIAFKSCSGSPAKSKEPYKRPFRVSINTSTISGFNLSLKDQIEMSAKAGYEGIELWIRDVYKYIDEGGKASDVAKMLTDNGLILENIIAHSTWMNNDPQANIIGVEEMRKDMDMTAQLGGHHIAATSRGLDAFVWGNIDMYGKQYAEILEIGKKYDVRPLLEVWGHRLFNQMYMAVTIALKSNRSDLGYLLDFYHLYRGQNSFDSLATLAGETMPVFHINDYPGPNDIPIPDLTDADRVYPGDGICPFNEVLPLLYERGFRGTLSLELFNESYWKTDSPQQILEKGYNKTVEVIDKAMANVVI